VEELTLTEMFNRAQRYDLVDADQIFDAYKHSFLRMAPTGRMSVLMQWDDLLEHETRRTRQHAHLVSRRRELDDMHKTLLRASR
jgi:hypothetical protein